MSVYSTVVCLVSVVIFTSAQTNETRYDGYQLLRVHPTSSRQVAALRELHDDEDLKLDFWTSPVLDREVDILVPPSSRSYVKRRMKKAGLSRRVAVDDIQSVTGGNNYKLVKVGQDKQMGSEGSNVLYNGVLDESVKGFGEKDWSSIDKEIDDMANARASNTGRSTPSIVGTYARHSEINTWLTDIASKSKLATVTRIGKSYEGRDMKLIKIRKKSRKRKPVIWIEAGIHAREWIAPAVAVWTIDKLIKNYGTDDDVTFMLDTFDWFFLPSANPDGYEYTFTNDRLWRKTRSPQRGGCYGVDPNRNFDVDFGGAGTSSNPCSLIYPGKRAFSEPETNNIRKSIWRVRRRTAVFLSFHSYSQLMLTPYGYTSSKPSDYPEMFRVANASMSALKEVHGKTFIVGTPPDILYAASGGSYDWAKLKARVKYSYTYELRPTPEEVGNTSGFIIGEDQIIPSGEEVWASLVTIAREVKL